MDLVSYETIEEYEHFKDLMSSKYFCIWQSFNLFNVHPFTLKDFSGDFMMAGRSVDNLACSTASLLNYFFES